jgi:hypothetical protein
MGKQIKKRKVPNSDAVNMGSDSSSDSNGNHTTSKAISSAAKSSMKGNPASDISKVGDKRVTKDKSQGDKSINGKAANVDNNVDSIKNAERLADETESKDDQSVNKGDTGSAELVLPPVSVAELFQFADRKDRWLIAGQTNTL